MSEVTEMIHKHGCPVFIQLGEAGKLEAEANERYATSPFTCLRLFGDG